MPQSSPGSPPSALDHQQPEQLPAQMPILPIASTVLFPTGVTALQITEDSSFALLEQLEEDGVIGIFCHVDEEEDARHGQPRQLAEVGVAARVLQRLKLGADRAQILCHGLTRIRLDSIDHFEPFLLATVSPATEARLKRTVELEALMGRALDTFERLVAVDSRYSKESVEVLRTNTDASPSYFSDLAASFLNVSLADKRRLITMSNPADRLHLVIDLTEREMARVSVERDVDDQVRVDIEAKKREYHLREQLRVIQQALGEEHSPRREAEEYAAMIEHLPVDDDSKMLLQRECDRLAIMSTASAEYPAQSNYLDTLFGLPWWEKTQDSLSLPKVERLLGKRHYGVDEVKERLLEYLAVVKLKGEISGPILCLVGPPGTGKTSISRSIADAMGRKFVRLSLGGVSDESEIRGHRKTYVGAMPGKIINAYEKVGARNPVILLDEIDKLGRSHQGDPSAALLEVLDPEQNTAFMDHYIGVPFSLSDTLFIATANVLDAIPGPLRDRLEIITISGYTEEEKVEIARRFIRPKLLEDHGIDRSSVTIDRGALTSLIRGYTSEAGVRGLERKMAAICRKVAHRRARQAKKDRKTERVTASNLPNYLGPKMFHQEFAGRHPEVGVSTGLAWTGAGGSILFIEATRMQGTGAVKVTGQLGDVMRESVETALSYVRTHSRFLEIPAEAFKEHDIHIHFPAGAIPKDGPSAGVAIATCLASLYSGRPVRHEVAMTGEITLRGKLLSVGGIREKVLAAHRARIGTVLIPVGNRRDLERVPEEIRKELRIILADRVEHAWEAALIPVLMADDAQVERLDKGESIPESTTMAAKMTADPKPQPGARNT